MKLNWFLLLLLSAAVPLRSEEFFSPDREPARIYFHRADFSLVRNIPDGSDHLVKHSDAPESAYFDYQLTPAKVMPEFSRAAIRQQVRFPAGGEGRSVKIRLEDAEGETFQFSKPCSGTKELQEVVFEVNDSSFYPGSWGEKNNGKLDLPVKFKGVLADFVSPDDAVEIGSTSVDVMESRAPMTPELLTGEGTLINVLRAGQEGELKLRLENKRNRKLSGKLNWALSGVRGEILDKKSISVSQKPGETGFYVLPRPELFGVYTIDVSFREDDPEIRPFERTMRFAYMDPAGPTPGRSEGFIFGMCSHPQWDRPEEQQREAMAAGWCGVKALRDDALWGRIQPEKGKWDFSSFDRVADTFGKYNIEILPILSYEVSWAVAAEWKPVKPEYFQRPRPDYEYWREFVIGFVEHYRGRMRFAEVWNEPDLYGFANFPENEYVRMMEIAYEEIKKRAPEWTVMNGGFACLPGQSGAAGNPEVIPAVIRSGKYDVFAFHAHGTFNSYHGQIERLPALGNTRPWYANETAISAMGHGETFQAETLFRKLIYSWARGSIGYNWYNLRNKGEDPDDNEHHFGLITRDFQPKKAYVAYNALAGLFRNAVYLREIGASGDLYAWLFRKSDGKLLLPGWSDNSNFPLLVSGVNGNAARVDLYGNVQPLTVQDGAVWFEAGSEPGTLVFDGDQNEVRIGSPVRPVGSFDLTPGGEDLLRVEFSNPAARPQEFRIRLELPEGVRLFSAPKPFRLAPGETKVVEYQVAAAPDFRSFSGHRKPLKLHLAVGGHSERTLECLVGTAVRVPESGYRKTPDFVLNESSQLTRLMPNSPDHAHLFWKGAQDLSAKLWLGRDGDTLQVKAEVSDDRHSQPFSGGEVWKGDNLQLGMQIPGRKGLWEIGLSRLDSGLPEVFVWQAQEGFDAGRAASAINLKVSRDEAKQVTLYEARIPFDAIGLAPKAEMRFNFLVNDNDGGGRESYLALSPGLGDEKNPLRYPTVKF